MIVALVFKYIINFQLSLSRDEETQQMHTYLDQWMFSKLNLTPLIALMKDIVPYVALSINSITIVSTLGIL